MKRETYFKLISFAIVLMISSFCFSQNPLKITMKIDFNVWERGDSTTFYDAITFSDNYNDNGNGNPDNGKKGRAFRSIVKRNLRLEWNTVSESQPDGSDIVLISVMRNPKPGIGGNELFDSSWYDAEYDDGEGYIVKGRIKNVDIQDYESERYVISFAVRYADGYYDIYTVDPIIRGSE